MNAKKIIALVFAAFALLAFAGCASSQQKGTVMPGADIAALKTFYVVHIPADGREINKLIAADLTARGYQATTGEAVNTPADVDAIVTYQDKWMWDMSMYLLQLDIQLRNPKTEVPLATGQSLRTSLARRSPKEMVAEVLDQIYQKAGITAAPAMGTH